MDFTKNPTDKELEQVDSQFKKVAKAIQRELLTVAFGWAASMAFGDGGGVVFNIANARNMGRGTLRIRALLAGKRDGLLQRILKAFLELFEKNTGYFKAQNLTVTGEDRARKRLLLLYGYDEEREEVIAGSYLDNVLNLSGVAGQISRALSASMQAGETLDQMRTRLRGVIAGQTGTGAIQQHFNRFTGDLFAQFDRAVKQDYAQQLGLTNAIYAGTAIDDTRPFCLARINRVYTMAEIDSWNQKKWAGKARNLPTQIACGGYNCRHVLNYVSDGIAERVAKRRGGLNSYDPGVTNRGEL